MPVAVVACNLVATILSKICWTLISEEWISLSNLPTALRICSPATSPTIRPSLKFWASISIWSRSEPRRLCALAATCQRSILLLPPPSPQPVLRPLTPPLAILFPPPLISVWSAKSTEGPALLVWTLTRHLSIKLIASPLSSARLNSIMSAAPSRNVST